MANRYIAFGYEITDGQIAIIESECLVVERIFAMYLNGKSLLEIAERLNTAGISYNNDGRSWNKNMVKRILENRKYLGEDGYPAILIPEVFGQADKIKREKYHLTSDEQKQLFRILHARMICGICGEHLKRMKDSNKKKCRYDWKCINPNCESKRKGINELKLYFDIAMLFNLLIANIDQYCSNEEKELNGQIPVATQPQIIYNPNIPIEEIVADICRAAEQRYAASRTIDDTAINQKLKQQLALYTHLEQIDLPLLQAVAQKIILYPEQRIGIQLPNGRVVKGGAQDAGCIPADGDSA